jgi:hypothetical protein
VRAAISGIINPMMSRHLVLCGVRATSTARPETGRFSAADGYHRTLAGFLNGTGQIGRQYEDAGEAPPIEEAVTTVNGLPADRRISLRLVAK